MRFLCLHGAFSSAKNFEVQLGPICQELSSDGKTSFFFVQGEIKCGPLPSSHDFFGPPPHYRFTIRDDAEKGEVVNLLREFPEAESAEDVLRQISPDGEVGTQKSITAAINTVYRIMDENGPFDVLCAYSEGSLVASTFILEERRRFMEDGIPRQIKAAVFFAGWPPVKDNKLVLVDTCDERIDIPTCHVVGAGDPYIKGSVALYNVCDEDTAILFDHGKGHNIPRDAKTVKELAATIRQMFSEGGDDDNRSG